MTSADSLEHVLRSAPELMHAPELAVAAANHPDPASAARALAHTARVFGTATAVATIRSKHGDGWFDDVKSFIGDAVQPAQDAAVLIHDNAGDWLDTALDHTYSGQRAGGSGGPVNGVPGAASQRASVLGSIGADIPGMTETAGQAAGVGLREVQHQYRAWHDIEARHGPVAGLLAGLGLVLSDAVVLPAAIGATAVSGGAAAPLALLGTEALSGAVLRTAFKDSWDRTENGEAYKGTYDRETGKYSGGPVSLGRDFADHLPHPLRFISGWTDGLADITFDPLVPAGKGFAAARDARLAVNTVADLDRALTSPISRGAVNRAFDDIGHESSAARITLRYPKFQAIAEDLAKTKNAGDVEQYFRNNLATAEFMSRVPGTIPNLPLTRLLGTEARQFVREYNGPGSGFNQLFTLLPTDFDESLLKLSNKDFDPSGNTWRQGVYRVLRFGQNDTVARNVVDAMSATDNLGLRRDIYVNAVSNMLFDGMGLSADNKFARQVMQQLEDTTAHVGGPEQIYSAAADGTNLSVLPAVGTTPARAAAVFENQTGRWSFPDFTEVLRARRAEGAIRNLYGAADDFFYDHWTQPVFKRGALLTLGFALRIAAAEAVPAAFREGLDNLVKSSIELRLGARAAKALESGDEVGHITAAVGRLLGGVRTAAREATAEDVDLATRAVIANGGHLVSPALEAGGGHGVNFLDGAPEAQARLIDKILRRVPPERRLGDTFDLFGQGPHHVDYWQSALAEASRSELGQAAATELRDALASGATIDEATNRATRAVRDVLDGKDEKWLGRFERHFTSTSSLDPHTDWARVVVDSVKGVTGHPYDPEFVHTDLLDHLAEGKTPPTDVLEGIAPAQRPIVKGRVETPYIPEGPVAAIANAGYKHVLDPIINHLSREPIYFNELKTQYAPLRQLVDEGLLNEQEALRIAQVRTVNAVTPFIHNPMERSQFAQVMRNFSPFWFAQTQAYRRVGRLLLDNPGAFRQYQMAASALTQVGHVVDEDGQKSLILPGAGFLTEGVVTGLGMLGMPVQSSVPTAFSGNVESLATVFPVTEDKGGLGYGPFRLQLGPVVAIPMHALQTLFPEYATPVANTVLGPVGSSGGFWQSVVPSSPLRNTLKAAGWIDNGRALANATNQAVASLEYRQTRAMRKWEDGGEKGPKPDYAPDPTASPRVRQVWLDRVKNQARVYLWANAVISAVSPLSPQAEIGDIGISDELRKLAASKGPDGQPLGWGGAVNALLQKDPDATPYTVTGSETLSGGYLPANHPAADWLAKHGDLLDRYPEAGAWLIPQADAPFDQQVYNEQLAVGLRRKKAPEQVMNDIYVAMGNHQFYDVDDPAHQAALAAAGDDPDAVKAENANWSAYVKNVLGNQNPIWYDDFTSSSRRNRRDHALTQLRDIFASNAAPAGKQTDVVKSLLDDYDAHASALAAGKEAYWSREERQAEDDNWQAYLARLATDKPALAPIINGLFRSL